MLFIFYSFYQSFILNDDTIYNSHFIFLEPSVFEKSKFYITMSIQSTTQKTPIVDKGLDATTIKKL